MISHRSVNFLSKPQSRFCSVCPVFLWLCRSRWVTMHSFSHILTHSHFQSQHKNWDSLKCASGTVCSVWLWSGRHMLIGQLCTSCRGTVPFSSSSSALVHLYFDTLGLNFPSKCISDECVCLEAVCFFHVSHNFSTAQLWEAWTIWTTGHPSFCHCCAPDHLGNERDREKEWEQEPNCVSAICQSLHLKLPLCLPSLTKPLTSLFEHLSKFDSDVF